MKAHVAQGGAIIPCTVEAKGHCRICDLIDRAGPRYREDYRRLFHPEEFGGVEVPAPAPPALPLAGDLVAALAARIGADRAAAWVATKLGAECGCAARREALNRLDRAVRKFLGLG